VAVSAAAAILRLRTPGKLIPAPTAKDWATPAPPWPANSVS
jgi:hypothetical protein